MQEKVGRDSSEESIDGVQEFEGYRRKDRLHHSEFRFGRFAEIRIPGWRMANSHQRFVLRTRTEKLNIKVFDETNDRRTLDNPFLDLFHVPVRIRVETSRKNLKPTSYSKGTRSSEFCRRRDRDRECDPSRTDPDRDLSRSR